MPKFVDEKQWVRRSLHLLHNYNYSHMSMFMYIAKNKVLRLNNKIENFHDEKPHVVDFPSWNDDKERSRNRESFKSAKRVWCAWMRSVGWWRIDWSEKVIPIQSIKIERRHHYPESLQTEFLVRRRHMIKYFVIISSFSKWFPWRNVKTESISLSTFLI